MFGVLIPWGCVVVVLAMAWVWVHADLKAFREGLDAGRDCVIETCAESDDPHLRAFAEAWRRHEASVPETGTAADDGGLD